MIPKKTLLFIVNISDFFLSHRLPIAIDAIKKGYEVCLATGDTHNQVLLKSLGITHYHLPLSRSGKHPLKELKLIFSLYKLIKKVNPTIIHTVSIKPVLYAGLVNRTFFRIPIVSAISGLGYLFMREGIRARCIQSLLMLFYRAALGGKKNHTLFQNSDDLNTFLDNNILNKAHTTLIKGAGVSLTEYQYMNEPLEEKINILLPARLLWDKGVKEFVEAAKCLGPKYPVIFTLVGDLDIGNPSVIDKTTLNQWLALPFVEWLGFQKDMLSCYKNAHIVCLPSYREGMPRALLEAQACGKPVVTTNVPGCREAITPNVTGFLVPSKQVAPLVQALEKLIKDKSLREQMGKNARAFAEKEFSIESVVQKTLKLYDRLV